MIFSLQKTSIKHKQMLPNTTVFCAAVTVAVLWCAAKKNQAIQAIPVTAKAPSRVPQGVIAFTLSHEETGDENREIYVMNPDGTALTRLTYNLGFDSFPDFSKDGRKITFDSTRSKRSRDIYVMNADGTAQLRLTQNDATDAQPAFSPNGSKIAFLSNRGGKDFALYTINTDGSSPARVSDQYLDDPVFSPDGKQIAFSDGHIGTMNADGSGAKQFGKGRSPAFSPDGKTIAFSRSLGRHNQYSNIYVMRADGTSERPLSEGEVTDSDPIFSPDGRYIAFSRLDGKSETVAQSNIYVMDTDGKNIRPLTTGPGQKVSPSWGTGGPVNPQAAPTPAPGYDTPVPSFVTPQFSSATSGVVASDQAQLKLNQSFEAQLIYSFLAKTPDTRSLGVVPTGWVSLQIAATPDQIAARQSSVLTQMVVKSTDEDRPPLNDSAALFRPQLSPDGRHLLFMYGTAQYGNPYDMFTLDITSNQVKRIAEQPALPYVSWSPDSSCVAWVNQGEADGSLLLRNRQGKAPALFLFNQRTGRQDQIADEIVDIAPLAWIAPHKLVYSLPPKEGELPNIYGFSVETGKSSLLIKEGFRPSPSPDGRWIAFFGPDAPPPKDPFFLSSWRTGPGGWALTVVATDGSKRIELGRQGGLYPMIVWLPDNQRFLTITPLRKKIGGGPYNRIGMAEVKEWNIQTQKWRLVATLTAPGYVEGVDEAGYALFRALPIVDNQNLWVVIEEPVSEAIYGADVMRNFYLQSIHLESGTVTSIAELKNASGVDWHSIEPPAKSPNEKQPAPPASRTTAPNTTAPATP